MTNPEISRAKPGAKTTRERYLAVLQEASQIIATAEGTTEEVLLAVLQRIVAELEYCAVQLYRVSSSGNELWLYLEQGPGSKPVTQNVDIFSIDEQNIVSDALRGDQLVFVPDVGHGPYSYFGQEDTDPPAGSDLALPLKFRGEALGVLRAQSDETGAVDEVAIDLIMSLSNLLASTLKNSLKIQQLQGDIQEIKDLYQLQNSSNPAPGQTKHRRGSVAYLYDNSNITKADSALRVNDPLAIIEESTKVTSVDEGTGTELISPIRLNGQTIGVLGVEDDVDGQEWSAEDINLLEEVSSQVGLAIENSQLLQQTQQRTKELSILFEATRQLTETIDLTQIYEILTNQLINYLNADRCSVLLLNEARTHFELGVEKDRDGKTGHSLGQIEPRFEALDDFPSLRQMLSTPDIIVQQIDDPQLEASSRDYMRRQTDQEVQTLTRFPLIVRSKLVAIMEVEHCKQRHDFTRNELQLAQAIIGQVTVAIENAQLFLQIELALSETQNLYEISRSLVESTGVDDIFDIVLRNIRVFDVDRVSISLLDRSRSGEIETVTIAATWDRDPDKVLPIGTKFSADSFPLVHTFAQPPFHPLISNNLAQADGQDERMDEAFRNFVHQDLGAFTMFSAPMFLGAEYKGVLSIYTRKPHVYNEQEIRIYQNLADQAIIAIENHRLLEATRRERDRASMLYELGQTLSKTATVEEVNDAVLAIVPQVGATDCEIFISDGGEFVAVASSISERQRLSLEKREASTQDFLEKVGVYSSGRHKQVFRTRSETPEEAWVPAGILGLPEIGTFTCIPFYSQRSTLQGVISFFHTEVNAFSEDHLTTFDSIAIQTATSLENVWLLRQTNIVLSETELLYKATTGFNSAQTFDDLLMVLVDSLTELDVDRMSIGLIPRSKATSPLEQLDIVASWHRQTGEISTNVIRLTADQYSFIQEMRPNTAKEIHYNILDVTTQTNIDQNLGRLRTILSIPLAVGQDWLGELILASQSNDFVFKINTINQIFNLAGQAAVVIQNLQLVDETQKNLFNSEILSNLGQELLVVETADAIYEVALAAIAGTQPDRGVAILMYDQLEGGIDLELVGIWNNPEQEWPVVPIGARFSTEELGLSPLLKTGLTVISNNASQDERFSAMLRQLLALMQINVMVAVPLWINKDVGGFMLIGNQNQAVFSADTVRLYEDIARQTSGALENRRLFDQAQYRAEQLQTAAEVSQVATSQLDLAALLPQSVDLISKRFGFHHVSIFLVDEYRRYAVVEAATGDVGQKMLAMKHRIEVGGQSIVGSATGTGEPRIGLDVGEDAVHFNNPLLSETRSEIALPLIAQGQVIGALDVQSTERAAFSDSDINILQTVANQLTNAIEAARAFQKSRDALEEVSKLHEYYLRDQWGAYLKEEKAISGYHLLDSGLVLGYHDDGFIQPEASKAIADKEPVIIHAPPQPTNGKQKKTSLGQGEVNGAGTGELDGFRSDAGPTDPGPDDSADISKLIAPLTLKGQAVIGTVDFEIPEKDLTVVWDEDTQRIVEAVTSQAAQAIEAARLFEQTQISREEAEALYDVGRSTVRVESEQELFNTVLGKLLTTLGLSQGGILFIDEDGKFGTLHALYRGGGPVDDPNIRFPITGNLSYEKLIETKRPIAIEDMATDPLVAKIRDMDLASNIASLLLVPIVINDVVIGAVGADAVGERHMFTEREINLAMAMADQLSIALQNRRLIEETSRRAVLLQTSADVGRVATSILDQKTMIDQAVDLIRNRFGFYHAQIFLIDEVGQFAVLHKSSGESQLAAVAGEHKLAIGSQSVIGQVTHQRKPIVVRNRNGDGSSLDALSRNEFLPETQSELAIPLQVGDTLIGALDVQSTVPDAFTEEEIFTLETLAAQLAIAIQNARAFKEQQETAERLKEIDKLKTQFLANMSHELRTPLNSIIGFSRVILKGIDGPLTELQKADLTSIHNSGQHLLGLINNILDLSKIEAGKMELNFADTEIEPIIKTVMSTAIALVKDKHVTLRQEIPENLPTVWVDSTRIRQVVLNLISNACKFTDEGTVTARVRTEGDSVVFSVSDTGIGIPDGLIPTIFEEFTQVDASTTRKAGGTGLGLPISRHFIEMHHGKIWVDSDVGRGSTFSFYIPIKPPHRQDLDLEDDFLDSEDLDDGHKRLIIAIDDDPSVITLYRRFLEKQNYEVVGISQTENVISRVREYAPSAILLDVVLPGKDGWVILKDLKDDPFTKDIPVIMCSIISDKNRGFSLGAADYLTKPIAEEKLIGALKQLDNQDGQEIKVLVVDDQADDILLIRRILEAQSNYNIIEAENGREGLELIKDKEPDLIILDLNMPEMDGFATIEALKSSERTRQIPIIIVSAQDLTRDEQRRLTGQVEALLHKGLFTENELLEDVSRALEKVGREEKIII